MAICILSISELSSLPTIHLYKILNSVVHPKISLSLHEQFIKTMEELQGQTLTLLEIKQKVKAMFPETSSVVPSHHSLGGSCQLCSRYPIFARTGSRGEYRVSHFLFESLASTSLNASEHPTTNLQQLLQSLYEKWGIELF